MVFATRKTPPASLRVMSGGQDTLARDPSSSADLHLVSVCPSKSIFTLVSYNSWVVKRVDRNWWWWVTKLVGSELRGAKTPKETDTGCESQTGIEELKWV